MSLVKSDFECEACAARFQALHVLAEKADALVAKGLKLSEVASIARAERRMQRTLALSWRNRVDQATQRAERSARQSNPNVELVSDAIVSTLKMWLRDVERPFQSSLEEIHFLGRIAGWKKASGKTKSSLAYGAAEIELLQTSKAKGRIIPDFGLVDRDALDELRKDQMIWLKGNFKPSLRRAIRRAVKESLKAGLGRVEAGARLKAALESSLLGGTGKPFGFAGTAEQYYELVAASVATTARNRAQIRSFSELEIERYVVVNPMDDRTSIICQHMNGKQFTVAQGMAQIESESGVTDPDEAKRVHPWLSDKDFLDITSEHGHVSDADSDALAEAGMALPPYHGKCRSTVDIV